MKKIQIIQAKVATTNIELGLVELTKFLTKKVFNGEWQGGGLLGGEFGYGVEFENETLMMRPFCWCEKDDCKWCDGTNPNFLFKPTGGKIWWYKWIGRDTKRAGKFPKNWLEICKKSIPQRSPKKKG